MAKHRQKKFDAGSVVREMARERIGQPKPTAVIRDKRAHVERRRVRTDIQAALRGE